MDLDYINTRTGCQISICIPSPSAHLDEPSPIALIDWYWSMELKLQSCPLLVHGYRSATLSSYWLEQRGSLIFIYTSTGDSDRCDTTTNYIQQEISQPATYSFFFICSILTGTKGLYCTCTGEFGPVRCDYSKSRAIQQLPAIKSNQAQIKATG